MAKSTFGHNSYALFLATQKQRRVTITMILHFRGVSATAALSSGKRLVCLAFDYAVSANVA